MYPLYDINYGHGQSNQCGAAASGTSCRPFITSVVVHLHVHVSTPAKPPWSHATGSCAGSRSRLRNLTNNKVGSPGRIDLVVPVLGSDDDAIVANVVALVADDEGLGHSNQTEGLVAVGVTESNNC